MTAAQASALRLQAPAKLNAFLHIVGRRADGYHELQSAFLLIDWCDDIELRLRADGVVARHLESNGAGVSFDADDLCTRAARALQSFAKPGCGVDIHLHKHIPAQAGMGGGSSDAATVLLGLNRLWQLNLAPAQLRKIGLALGADVPFFIGQQHAWVEGIGEDIQPFATDVISTGTRVLVVKPADGLATARIFGAPDLRRDTPRVTSHNFTAHGLSFGKNDLQRVAERICPEVSEALRWTNAALGRANDHPLAARMTGSGSAVFGFLGGSEPDLTALPSGWQAKVCRTL